MELHDRNGEPAGLLDRPTKEFYLRALDLVEAAGVRYVVGGAYAMAYHAGIVRHTKDLDLFIRAADLPRALDAFAREGCRVVRTHPHWLAKAYSPDPSVDAFIDFIFRSGNGLCPVDAEWLRHAVDGAVLGRPAPICPAEEVIWSKAFVMARERFDGADIAHVIRARGHDLDWDRLLRRFDGSEELLLGHLLFFRFIYPGERRAVPARVVDTLINRVRTDTFADGKLCRGTLLSWDQYQVDLDQWGYQDARLQPHGALTREEVEQWTVADK